MPASSNENRLSAPVEHCTLYLPTAKFNKSCLPPGAETNGGLLQRASEFTFDCGDGPVRLNMMKAGETAAHLQGFLGYISTLENVPTDLATAKSLIEASRIVLGVVLSQPIEASSETFAALTAICKAHGGFAFVSGSILTSDGFLVGPASYPEADVKPLATVNVAIEESEGRLPAKEQTDRREASLAILEGKGFVCAASLPLPVPLDDVHLRPPAEIAARFGAAALAYLYCLAPDDFVSTGELQALASSDELSTTLTTEEREILSLPRQEAREKHGGTIGWTLETMWGLAWALGFQHELEVDTGQIGDAAAADLIPWMPIRDQTVANMLAGTTPRSPEEVASREDLFFCAHNAVRSAQMGSPTVPSSFDPKADGGTVHERRHALTWCLSPGIAWDETDLST